MGFPQGFLREENGRIGIAWQYCKALQSGTVLEKCSPVRVGLPWDQF